ncbi:zinc finger protein on ecdysone puffs [Polistes fuscatus]|uniref:zinc finger protein on ecdysone puffs n=1 Tax=Polistes fuscatus TaxID=30207 RepID=UPI001CA9745F|nr:zinc finger protein on ecdysone puffs [Polistes fuscatus]
MSFNRGLKRDTYGNRNFNNRGNSGGGGGRPGNIGGGGGGMGSNMGGGMGGGGGNSGMNPWEGGMMPGRGILPTPNNNISLASPQAQLAIASNLLSNLLRTQQETQPQVPSLLSLGNNFSGPGPNFPNQQNFSSGRFNDRPVRHPVKNQRPQPYKMGNRARDGPAGRRGPSAQQSRAPQSGNQRMNGNQNQHRNDKSSKPIPASKQNQAAKKEQQDNKTSDNEKAEAPVVKSEHMEESVDKKRDWKDEKNEAEEVKIEKAKEEDSEVVNEKVQKEEEEEEKKLEKSSTTTTATSTTTTTTTTTTHAAVTNAIAVATEDTSKEANAATADKDSNKATGKKSEARHAESRYAEVPMSHMFCYICNKHMWDGYSFENHLRGRAHQLMMEKLDESYKLKVDLMRHELRVAEEQRGLSLNNSKRRGKKIPVDLNIREYCTMCDLNFYGTLSTHRKSEKHQQLKTFLHPRCFPCLKEFPSRIEYDEHCLTPAHMKNAVQCEEHRKNKKKEKLGKGEAEVRTAEDEEKDVGPDQKSEKEEESGEFEFITDISENLKDKKFKIPSYRYCRQNQVSIGKSLVKEIQGYYCEKCRRFMLLPEDMNAHLRSITHYRNFVQEVKSLNLPATNSSTENKETEDIESKRENSSQNSEEYEGNWKRRKVTHSEGEDNGESKETLDNSNESSSGQKKTDGDEKYDPLEADAESEEDENNEAGGNNEKTSENISNEQEKKPSGEKMWLDVDNDNDHLELGNLIDEGDEKEHTELEKITAPVTVEVTPHTPQMNKSPRGRGYSRGRGGGGPRARRSRR